MRKGIAYFLVVIATACEHLAGYIMKGKEQPEEKGIRISVKHVTEDYQDDFGGPRWLQ